MTNIQRALLIAILALAAALTAERGSAAVLVACPLDGQAGDQAGYIDAFFSSFIAESLRLSEPVAPIELVFAVSCTATLPVEEENRGPRVEADGIFAGMSAPSATTGFGSAGVNVAALPSENVLLPNPSVTARLAREASLILPAGPVFELLRPS